MSRYGIHDGHGNHRCNLIAARSPSRDAPRIVPFEPPDSKADVSSSLLPCCVSGRAGDAILGRSVAAAVHFDSLSVDPAALGARQERDNAGNAYRYKYRHKCRQILVSV